MDADSNAEGAKNASESSSNDSRSDSNKSKRPPTVAELKEIINLQSESAGSEISDQGLFEPAFKNSYSLIYGTKDLYMVFKTIASIYERLSKAQQLIREKVELDLKRSDIRDVIGIEDPAELEAFGREATVERFKLFINALIGTLSQAPHKKLDPSNYEDIVRVLMGEQAFLLFVFDKLILQVSSIYLLILLF